MEIQIYTSSHLLPTFLQIVEPSCMIACKCRTIVLCNSLALCPVLQLILLEYIHAQLMYHSRAMELFTAAYQKTLNINEQEVTDVSSQKKNYWCALIGIKCCISFYGGEWVESETTWSVATVEPGVP